MRVRITSAAPGALTDSAEQKLADTISTGLNKMGIADGLTTASAKGPAEAPEAVAAANGPGAARSGSRPGTAPVGTSLQKPHVRTPILTPAPTLALKGLLPAALADAGEAPAFGSWKYGRSRRLRRCRTRRAAAWKTGS